MVTQRKRPTDFTGRQREVLQAQMEDQIRSREGEIAMASELEAAQSNEVVDYASGAEEVTVVEDGGETVLEVPSRTIRVNTSLESMTFGYGNNYTFEEGKQYKVPAALANHLEELGYVWH